MDEATSQYCADETCLAFDIVRIMIEGKMSYEGKGVYIRGVSSDSIDVDDSCDNFEKINFKDCFFNEGCIGECSNLRNVPNFISCYFGSIDGRVSKNDLPNKKFSDDCVFDDFQEKTLTTNAITKSDFSNPMMVALSILKKLYIQAGRGRQRNALNRGLSPQLQKLVPDILIILRRNRLAIEASGRTEEVWLPVQYQLPRVLKILGAPKNSNDPVIEEIIKG